MSYAANLSGELVTILPHWVTGPIPPLDPPPSLTNKICVNFDNFSIYHWDNFINKSKCFDYGDFVSAREIEDNIYFDVELCRLSWIIFQ